MSSLDTATTCVRISYKNTFYRQLRTLFRETASNRAQNILPSVDSTFFSTRTTFVPQVPGRDLNRKYIFLIIFELKIRFTTRRSGTRCWARLNTNLGHFTNILFSYFPRNLKGFDCLRDCIDLASSLALCFNL